MEGFCLLAVLFVSQREREGIWGLGPGSCSAGVTGQVIGPETPTLGWTGFMAEVPRHAWCPHSCNGPASTAGVPQREGRKSPATPTPLPRAGSRAGFGPSSWSEHEARNNSVSVVRSRFPGLVLMTSV